MGRDDDKGKLLFAHTIKHDLCTFKGMLLMLLVAVLGYFALRNSCDARVSA